MMRVQVQMSRILQISVIFAGCLAYGVGSPSPDVHLIPCKEGWNLFGEKCYKVLGQDNHRTWSDASRVCASLGGNLAAVTSKELQDSLNAFLLLNVKSSVWIGLSEKSTDWSDGSTVDYTNWLPSEKRSRISSHEKKCTRLVFDMDMDMTGMWDDFLCSNKLPFICQVDKDEQDQSPDPRLCSEDKGGGFKHLSSCYHVVTKEESWEDAEEYCQSSYNGHLVTILNHETEIFLKYISNSLSQRFWIGVKIRDQPLQKWSSGWHAIFNRWAEEKELITGHCGLRTNYDHWVSDNCAKKYPFVCEISSEKPPILKRGEDGWRCPNSSVIEWKDFDGDFCYYFELRKTRKWYDANYDCMIKGGALAMILSEEESVLIHQHVKEGSRDRLFIGLHRNIDNKEIFEWIDGSQLDYQNWDPGEPNSIHEGCGELYTSHMKWNDVPCNLEKSYICSAKKLPPILYEDNIPVADMHIEKCHQRVAGDSVGVGMAVLITTICIFAILIVLGTVIYLFRNRCGEYAKLPSQGEMKLIQR